MDELTALASQQLERVKALCSQVELQYADLPAKFVGVGIAIGFGETDYTVCSIMGGGSETQLLTTSGLLKDISRDREAALSTANRFNQQNSAYSVYLHDADAGWALLIQRTTPIEVFLNVPRYFEGLVRALPMAVQELRPQVADSTDLGGRPWHWSDRDDLLLRSML